MIREEIKDNIYVASDRFYDNYYDQCFISFPCVYPTVCVYLESTIGLDKLADRTRAEHGFTPLFDFDGTGCEYNDNGWYNFYVDLNGYNKHHVSTCICFTVSADDEPDDGREYMIDLSEDEQEYIYQLIDKDIDCERCLREAVKELKEDYGVKLTILERTV